MDFLNKNNIVTTGRYGGWGYSSMEENIIDGKLIADKILKQLK